MNASAELLKELRIDRKNPPPSSGDGPGGRRRPRVIVVVIALPALRASPLSRRPPHVAAATAPAVLLPPGTGARGTGAAGEWPTGTPPGSGGGVAACWAR
mgnify:CR=1 FL=1